MKYHHVPIFDDYLPYKFKYLYNKFAVFLQYNVLFLRDKCHFFREGYHLLDSFSLASLRLSISPLTPPLDYSTSSRPPSTFLAPPSLRLIPTYFPISLFRALSILSFSFPLYPPHLLTFADLLATCPRCCWAVGKRADPKGKTGESAAEMATADHPQPASAAQRR